MRKLDYSVVVNRDRSKSFGSPETAYGYALKKVAHGAIGTSALIQFAGKSWLRMDREAGRKVTVQLQMKLPE